jgi:hypothetical protein
VVQHKETAQGMLLCWNVTAKILALMIHHLVLGNGVLVMTEGIDH